MCSAITDGMQCLVLALPALILIKGLLISNEFCSEVWNGEVSKRVRVLK